MHASEGKKRAYHDYEEAKVNFLPTYKRGRMLNQYQDKKNQAPSYTDRILVRNNTNQDHEVKRYDVLDDVYGSDHRPVVLDFKIRVVNEQFLNEVSLIDTKMAKS